ncbi:MAG: polyprenyl synthetase family protein [Anaplasma sp.]
MHHDIPRLVRDFASLIDEELLQVVKSRHLWTLDDALRYVVSSPGKRLRPFLASTSAQIFGVSTERTLRLGAAIESMHMYSLVHDDLPCVDDAPMRHGRESCHKKFGEAVAVLTGDALLTFAFELLSTMDWDHTVRCEIVNLLAEACGRRGMVAGQVLDLEAGSEISLERVKKIHELKTGRLFSAACVAGAILGGASHQERMALAEYGATLGCAFQARDDLSDIEEDRDCGNIARILGAEGTSEYIDSLLRRCAEHLEKLRGDVAVLSGFVSYVENLRV